ncbi:hypothetical protein [Pectobacterium parmentieri]|uniref:hypothetical protein n=1 Tax=Pectobacterium parmentieri TaxID=1905730 RepID=UPI0018DF92BE|nr:hypothetical protein [Pectobacterium parmentieri]MBI0429670.1 hypothetical protein [Pectobacterium parmentieri]
MKLFQHYSPLITPAISIVTFIAGMFVGHWLSLGRDKRKEFNAVSDPIRMALLEQIDLVNDGYFPDQLIKKSDVNKIVAVAGVRSSRKIISAFNDYKISADESGSNDRYGKFTYKSQYSINNLIKSMRKLINQTKRR